jgi:hypothetical protein
LSVCVFFFFLKLMRTKERIHHTCGLISAICSIVPQGELSFISPYSLTHSSSFFFFRGQQFIQILLAIRQFQYLIINYRPLPSNQSKNVPFAVNSERESSAEIQIFTKIRSCIVPNTFAKQLCLTPSSVSMCIR